MRSLVFFLITIIWLSDGRPVQAQDVRGHWSVGMLLGPALTNRENKKGSSRKDPLEATFRVHGGFLGGYTGRSGWGFRAGIFPYNRFTDKHRNRLLNYSVNDSTIAKLCDCEFWFNHDFLELPLLIYYSPTPAYRIRTQYMAGIIPAWLVLKQNRIVGLPPNYATYVPGLEAVAGTGDPKVLSKMGYRVFHFSAWFSAGAVYDLNRHWQLSLNGIGRYYLHSLYAAELKIDERLSAFQLAAGAAYQF